MFGKFDQSPVSTKTLTKIYSVDRKKRSDAAIPAVKAAENHGDE